MYDACMRIREADKQKQTSRMPSAKMIGKRLAELRQQRGLSQSELSRQTGIAQSLISQYESGIRRIYGEVVAHFAQTLGVSTDEILAVKDVKARLVVKPMSRKIQRRAEMLENLPPVEQKHILRTIDMLLKSAGE